jgi:hypothetical protein
MLPGIGVMLGFVVGGRCACFIADQEDVRHSRLLLLLSFLILGLVFLALILKGLPSPAGPEAALRHDLATVALSGLTGAGAIG